MEGKKGKGKGKGVLEAAQVFPKIVICIQSGLYNHEMGTVSIVSLHIHETK